MTLRIRIDGGTAVISRTAGPLDLHPMRTGLVEARGALLTWDTTAAGPCLPHADVHDPTAAAEWLSQVYGEPIAAAVRDSIEGRFPTQPGAELCAAVQRLAQLRWARDWWPAGVSIPRLHPAVLAAETAVAVHRIEHLLADADALAHALQAAAEAPTALSAMAPRFRAEAAELLEVLTGLAADRKISLTPMATGTDGAAESDARTPGSGAASPDPDDPETDDGARIDDGIAAVRWADVPGQTVAADEDAHWSLQRVDDAIELSISVPAVSGAEASLMARFGPAGLGIDLPLVRVGGAFVARTAVPASVERLPETERTLWVRDPLLAAQPGEEESEDDRDDVRNRAVARLDDPAASLAERAAAR